MPNLILDIGNVICEWNPDKLVGGVFSDPDEREDALQAVIQHPDWRALDQGMITLEEAAANAAERCSLDPAKIRKVYERTPASLEPFPPVVEVIRDLHGQGVPLYVLSNMQKHSWEYLEETYDFWSLFEGIVVSWEINLLKPDPAIYRHITETYNLDPSNAVFVDDTLENVIAAREFGLRALHLNCSNGQIDKIYEVAGVPRSSNS